VGQASWGTIKRILLTLGLFWKRARASAAGCFEKSVIRIVEFRVS
jgi:hypothetical protein